MTPQLTLNMTVNGLLEVTLANGTTSRASSPPGAVVSAGTYQVIINNDVPDSRDVPHMFRVSGPGVNIQTDMAAGDDKTEVFTVVLQPGSTYTFQDDRQPSLAGVVFTTSSGAASATPSSATTTTSAGGGSTTTSSNVPVVGSGRTSTTFRGTLLGGIGPTGSVTLTRGGKRVTTLRAGRYTLTVVDKTPRSGFVLQEIHKRPIQVTGSSYVGRHSAGQQLSAGQWMFYSATGKKSYFIVVA